MNRRDFLKAVGIAAALPVLAENPVPSDPALWLRPMPSDQRDDIIWINGRGEVWRGGRRFERLSHAINARPD